MPKIPLMIININKSISLGKRITSLSEKLLTKQLKKYIKKSKLKIKAVDYINASLINSIIYGILFFTLFFLLYFSLSNIFIQSLIKSLTLSIIFSILFFVIFYIYPLILTKKIGNIINSELLYILNDLLVQVKAKVELYHAFINVVNSNLPSYTTNELQNVIDEVESGISMYNALKHLAVRTNSSFLKRVAWQLMNNIKSGSDPVRVIENLINELETYYYSLINNYIKELNVLTLIYLTIAIVAPTIGITVLIILSSFGGLSLNTTSMSIIIIGLLIIQPIIIGFIKSRRPFINL